MRLTSKDALVDPWFANLPELNDNLKQIAATKLDLGVVKRLTSYKNPSRLKKTALNFLVKVLEPEKLQDLRKQFEAIDLDRSGLISH